MISKAKSDNVCLDFLYTAPSKGPEIRTVDPVYLFHTPVSWFLIAFCLERKNFRAFKLARISSPRLSHASGENIPFDLKSFLGDAWWLQKGGAPKTVKVLFKGEAAQTIQEYNFHASQELLTQSDGTLATWRLSHLDEFASWLLQWLGHFEVIEPIELNEILEERIRLYRRLAKPRLERK